MNKLIGCLFKLNPKMRLYYYQLKHIKRGISLQIKDIVNVDFAA